MQKLISDIQNHLVKFQNLHADVMAAIATQPDSRRKHFFRYGVIGVTKAGTAYHAFPPRSSRPFSRLFGCAHCPEMIQGLRLPHLNARRDKFSTAEYNANCLGPRAKRDTVTFVT
jgi:hypothetical protein